MTTVPAMFWILSAAAFGAIFGSFINMAAHRLPRGISTWKRSRSFCPKCEHQLAWYDNVPILSYVSLWGRCRYCKAPIPGRYLYTELVTAALFALFAYQYFELNNGPLGRMPAAVLGVQLFLAADLVLLSVVDLEVWLIPIETTLYWIIPALIVGMIFPNELHPAMAAWTSYPSLNALLDSFFGLAIGGGVLWSVGFLVAILFCVMRGFKEAPPDAMGMGDVHLLLLAGALLGWKAALMSILIGVFIGSFVGISKILWGKFQRWRLGDRWTAPPQPTFDLPDEGEYTPQFWPLLVQGLILLLICGILNDRRVYIPLGTTPEFLVPLLLTATIGGMLVLAFPFYLYLRSVGKLPGGEVVHDPEDKRIEVYQGNYIPFGPSLAAGVLLVALYDPLLRVFADWFFTRGTRGPIGMWPYRLFGEAWVAAAMKNFLMLFTAFSRWLLSALGLPN